MNNVVDPLPARGLGRLGSTLLLVISLLAGLVGAGPGTPSRAQDGGQPVQFEQGIDPEAWYRDHEIEGTWRPDYLDLATGDPSLRAQHGVYSWPFALDSIGWNIQSYQDYGGTPYFHHGLDMMKVNGTMVFNRSGGQVINVENYQPGNYLYWEVAVLDPDGYIWQYHHIDQPTIPQLIWDKYAEYLADPVSGGFIPANTHLGNIVEWPVWSFGKIFNHIHLNILGAGGVYVNGFEFHYSLSDDDAPEIQGVGLLQNGAVYPGSAIEGDYSLYVHARDLVLDDVYYLPPFEITFSVDGGPVHTTWRFDTLPGGADQSLYLDDFYVPPTCGDYGCREFYIDLGFIPNSQFEFPAGGGEHAVMVTVSDYDGNAASQACTYTVIGPPAGTILWQDDFETDLGWITNPNGTDTATSGQWERGNPEPTYSDGPKQLGTTVSGQNDLVTGRLAGSGASSYDVDGGITSIRSPDIALPAGSTPVLSFRYYLAHSYNSSAADYMRVKVVGLTTATLFEELGAANDDDGAWALHNVDMSAFAGETVYLLVEAADADPASLVVEAAIDNVVVVDTNVNQAPVANPQAVSTAEDTPLDITLTGSDGNGDPLTYQVVLSPTHGTLSGTAPGLTYAPDADYFGADSLTFVISDGQATSAPALVSIDVTPVNDVPAADPQSLSTPEDTAIDITLSGSDVDDDALTYRVVLSPSHGTLSGTPPSLSYTPAADYHGPDAFTFVAHDGQNDSEPAEVSVDVTSVNDSPVAVPLSIATRPGMPVAIVLSGSDVDGDTLTYQVVTLPQHGTLAGSAPDLTYTPAPGYAGVDAFTFLVHDGELPSTAAEVTIAVKFVIYLPVTMKR